MDSLPLTFLPTVTSQILKQLWMPKWKGCRVLGLGPRKDRLKCWDEKLLWQKGLLGDATRQTLVDTMVYMNGLYCFAKWKRAQTIENHCADNEFEAVATSPLLRSSPLQRCWAALCHFYSWTELQVCHSVASVYVFWCPIVVSLLNIFYVTLFCWCLCCKVHVVVGYMLDF